jgi:penicillin-binding protein 2
MVLNLDEEKLARQNQPEDGKPGDNSGGNSRGQLMSRLNFLRVAIGGSFGLLTWRLWDMQMNRPPLVRNEARRETRTITIKAPRGIIYDATGKRLVTNKATYAVTITRHDLPQLVADKDLPKDKQQEQLDAQEKKRQDVFDSLARFLGMTYVVGIVPEQFFGDPKVGARGEADQNETLNILEGLLGMAALDLRKKLTEARKQDLFTLKDKIPLDHPRFDDFVKLRDRNGVYFMSEGEKTVFVSTFATAEFEPIVVWTGLSREDAMVLEEKRFDMPGVGIQTGYVRDYADPRLFAHLLGYIGPFASEEDRQAANKEARQDLINPNDPDDPANQLDVYDPDDKVGLAGVESTFEVYLRGSKGGRDVVVDSGGHIIETVPNSEREAVPGNSVYLTINWDLQKLVADSLEKQIAEANREKSAGVSEGAAVVMDVTTGQVVALVAFPYYDNNKFSKRLTEDEVKELFDPQKNLLLNRAISARYAPGSTFKLITALAGLNEGNINRNSNYNCSFYIDIPLTQNPTPTQEFKCWGQHNVLNVVGAIEQSCDIFFYNVGVKGETNQYFGANRYYERGRPNDVHLFRGIGIQTLNKYMDIFNLGRPSGIELPGEYTGNLPTQESHLKATGSPWSVGDTMTTSIGQGEVEMTPLQVCNMTAAIANGGILYQPTILKEVRDAKGNLVKSFEPIKLKELGINPAHLQTVREGMLSVTGVRGTANSGMYGKMGRLQVAGKTGTAEYGEPYDFDKVTKQPLRATHAWFTAFAPYEKPKYAVTVLIAAGSKQIEGSTFGVPAAREILSYLFPQETQPANPTQTPGTVKKP